MKIVKFHVEILELYTFPYVFVMPAQNRLKLYRNACKYRQKQLTDERFTAYAMMLFVQQVGVKVDIGNAFVCVGSHVSPSHLAGRRV